MAATRGAAASAVLIGCSFLSTRKQGGARIFTSVRPRAVRPVGRSVTSREDLGPGAVPASGTFRLGNMPSAHLAGDVGEGCTGREPGELGGAHLGLGGQLREDL